MVSFVGSLAMVAFLTGSSFGTNLLVLDLLYIYLIFEIDFFAIISTTGRIIATGFRFRCSAFIVLNTSLWQYDGMKQILLK